MSQTSGWPEDPSAPIRQSFEASGHTLYEEMANAITHGIATVLAGAGLALVVVLASHTGSAKAITACAIYGTAMVLVFLASTLHHGVWHRRVKDIFLTLDHCAIFLMIAGTYTPISLLVFPGASGWVLFGVIWGLAVAGIAVRIWKGDVHWMMIVLFVAMGWMVFIWGDGLYRNLANPGIWLLLSGGLAYTVGLAFYLWRRLPFSHAVWHVFVIAGSICHFLAIAMYALEAPGVNA